MLMGSADAVPEAPAEKTVFAEDMPADEVAKAQSTNPGGLSNLGNTCYLNSTLQCMKVIPEISTSLQKYRGGGGGGAAASGGDTVMFAMRDVLTELMHSSSAIEVKPFKFVSTFRTAFPMFAERTENGQGFVQQDAEECWSTIVNALSQSMKLGTDAEPSDLGGDPGASPTLPRMQALKRNLGDMLFGIEVESSYKCAESDDEPAYTARESLRKIACHISEKTAHLYNALEVNLDEVIEKQSAVLGREAQFQKRSRLARLPPYLAVQFVRFAWRKDTSKRAKILRNVSFPPILDVRNLCTTRLQACLAAHCTVLEKEEEEKKGAAHATIVRSPTKDDKDKARVALPDASVAPSAPDPMDVAPVYTPEELAEMDAETRGAECGDNRTGRYELFGVITHQGRTAEGGHYVAWVKKDKKTWLVYDDETVAEVDAERIKELYGGGDWHMAYMCLYRKMDAMTLD